MTSETSLSCPNCMQANSANAKFCSKCGQTTQMRPFGIFEVLHAFFDQYIAIEGSVWRTLGQLIARPGALSVAYMQGRRKSYLGPVRLFFSVSFVFLLIFSFMVDYSKAVREVYGQLLFEGDQTALYELIQFALSFLLLLSVGFAGILWLAKKVHGLSFGNSLLVSLHFHSFVLLIVTVTTLCLPLLPSVIFDMGGVILATVFVVYMAVMLWHVLKRARPRHSVTRALTMFSALVLYFIGYINLVHGIVFGFVKGV